MLPNHINLNGYKQLTNYYFSRFYKTILLFAVALSLSRCKWDESGIRIERFELLDEYNNRNDNKDENLNNQLLSEAYLIHGYKKKFDNEINNLVDRYVCDSIMPNLEFYDVKYIVFYKKSKNTNRENFQVRPKHKMIRARSDDILFSYWFYNINDSIVPKTKYFHAVGGKEDPPPQSFKCNK